MSICFGACALPALLQVSARAEDAPSVVPVEEPTSRVVLDDLFGKEKSKAYFCADKAGQITEDRKQCGASSVGVGIHPFYDGGWSSVVRTGNIELTEQPVTLKNGGHEWCSSYWETEPAGEPTRRDLGRSFTEVKHSEHYAKLIRDAALLPDAELSVTGIRIDLDGNGTEEVLFVATGAEDRNHPEDEEDTETLVTLMGIRSIEGTDGAVKTHIFLKTRQGYLAPPTQYAFVGVTDVEGDGTLEVVTKSWHNEGAGSSLWRFTGTSITPISSYGGCAN